MDAVIDGEKYSFALDNGASSSYVTPDIVAKLSQRHPDWPKKRGRGLRQHLGLVGEEDRWPMIRVPKIAWGALTISDAVIVGLPPVFRGSSDIGSWYSLRPAAPVNGFFGPNIFKAYQMRSIPEQRRLLRARPRRRCSRHGYSRPHPQPLTTTAAPGSSACRERRPHSSRGNQIRRHSPSGRRP